MDYAKVNEALYKKALGYDAEETSEEFGLVDGQLIVVKKKVTTKHYPPTSSVKILCDTEKDAIRTATATATNQHNERQPTARRTYQLACSTGRTDCHKCASTVSTQIE